MKELINILEDERSFMKEELRARQDPSPGIELSPYNQWLLDQIQEINIAIYEILNPDMKI